MASRLDSTINRNHHSIAFTQQPRYKDVHCIPMESSPSFLTLIVSFIMIAIIVDGRLNPGEYMQDSLVQGTSVSPLPMKKSHCHNLAEAKNNRNSFNKELEPRPNISVYDNGTGLKGMKKTDKEFEPRPNITIYDNGMNLKGTDFEPRPSVTGYDNGTSLKGERTFGNDFEPRPSVTGYDNGTGLKGERTFGNDFEPRPSVTGYDNGTGLKGKDVKVIASVTGYDA